MKLPGVAREAPPPPLVVDADAVDDAAGAAWPAVALPAPAPASGVASAAAAPRKWPQQTRLWATLRPQAPVM